MSGAGDVINQREPSRGPLKSGPSDSMPTAASTSSQPQPQQPQNQTPKLTKFLEETMERSKAWGAFQPGAKNLLCTLIAQGDKYPTEQLEKNFRSVRPVVHHRMRDTLDKWIKWVNDFGEAPAKAVYSKMTPTKLYERLLVNRPRAFWMSSDDCLLGHTEKDLVDISSPQWETVGTTREKAPLVVQDYLMYSEIKLAALMCVSSYTYFLNDGNRYNMGNPGGEPFEEFGVVMGLVGARYEKPNQMDWQDCFVSPQRTTECFGPRKTQSKPESKEAQYSNLWAEIYGMDHLPSYACAQQSRDSKEDRFMSFQYQGQTCYFDTHVYMQRIQLAADMLLCEANARGKESAKSVYVHVVGLGLGAWQLQYINKNAQIKLYCDAFAKVLSNCAFPCISDVDFSWVHCDSIAGVSDGEKFKGLNAHITIHISKRAPQAALQDKSKLLFVSYAWDGNAMPGNEYWFAGREQSTGYLSMSGDPAQAACCQIVEIHVPAINTALVEAVHADKLTVAGPSGNAPEPSAAVKPPVKK